MKTEQKPISLKYISQELTEFAKEVNQMKVDSEKVKEYAEIHQKIKELHIAIFNVLFAIKEYNKEA